MRIRLLIGVLTALLSSAVPAVAQTYPVEMRIIVPKVEVRSGPSEKFYATDELSLGATVTVLRPVNKDQPDWLEIAPPPGSFSWVSSKHVKLVKTAYGSVAVMDTDGAETVPALVGSAIVKTKPDVFTKNGFIRGSTAKLVAQERSVDGEIWYPVQPDLREVRFIPASAVRTQAVATTTAPTNWALGSKPNAPTTTTPGYPGGGAPSIKAVGSTMSFSPTPAPGTAASTAPTVLGPQRWSDWGTLRTTTFTKDGQPMYVLVGAQGQPLLYVTNAPGMSLRSYINRYVTVFGPIINHPDGTINVPYTVATHVAVP